VFFDIFHNYGSELNYGQCRANKTLLRIRGKSNIYQRVMKWQRIGLYFNEKIINAVISNKNQWYTETPLSV